MARESIGPDQASISTSTARRTPRVDRAKIATAAVTSIWRRWRFPEMICQHCGESGQPARMNPLNSIKELALALSWHPSATRAQAVVPSEKCPQFLRVDRILMPKD
jgi:hypothetical protein